MKQLLAIRLSTLVLLSSMVYAQAFAQIRPLASASQVPTTDLLRSTNTAYLLEWARQDSLRYRAERDSAIRFARLHGYPVTGNFEGQEYALQGFDAAGLLKYYGTSNAISAQAIRTNEVHPGGGAGLSLTGNGTVLGVWEISRPRSTHVELTGRVTQIDNSNQSIGDHATHVSGTMIASGVNPNARGMAYQANLAAWDANNDLSEMATAAAQGLRFSNHSYGSFAGWEYGNWSGQTGWHWWGSTSVSQTTDFKFGQYDADARQLDVIARNATSYLPVWAAGNNRNDTGPSPGGQHWVRNASNQWVSSTTTRQPDGGASGYDCISTTGNAKNILTVGALEYEVSGGLEILGIADFSSWGPTDDGRIKPDVMARGVDVFSPISTNNNSYDWLQGTSMAAPSVTASLGLLLQHYHNLNPQYTIPASALKALVIHTADQISGTGPKYSTGWGRMDTRAAADLLSNLGTPNAQSFMIAWDTVYNNNPRQWQFTHGGGDIKITAVWIDPAGTVQGNVLNPTTSRLVNDLDVRLIRQSDNTTFSPWRLDPALPASAATKGDNFRDNVEQVFETNLPAGTYTIRISHKGNLSGGSQTYSMFISVGDNGGNSNACSQATAISCGQTISGTTSGAAQNVPECITELNTAPGRWYRYTAAQTGVVVASTCHPGTDFDTKIGVFSGSCSNLVCVTGNDDAANCSHNSVSSTVQFNATSGQTYYIYVTGYGSNFGVFQLSLTCGGSCQIPENLAATSVGYAHIRMEASTVTGANGYQMRRRSGGGAWTEAPVYTTPVTIWGNLTPNTSYEFQIRSQCDTDIYSDWSPSVFATTLGAGDPYCYSYGLSWDHWISGVSIANQNFSSGNNYGYRNFTSIFPAADVQAGSTYTVTLTPQNSGSTQTVYWRVWIDFNKDNDFTDSGEQVFQATGNSGSVVTGSITIPASASTGTTRMRVSMNIGGSTYPAPCDSGSSRDVEDYAVNIAPSVQAPLANFSASATCGQVPLSVNFSDLSSNAPTSWSWNFGNGQTSPQQNPSTTYTQPGTYTVTLNATNAGGSDSEIKTAYITVVAPVSVSASSNTPCAGDAVVLTAIGATSYTWTGTGVNSTTGSPVTAQPAAPGSYTYTVVGSTNGCAANPASINLTFNPLPTMPSISANGSTSLCAGQSVTITAANVCSDCTVNWSNGQSGPAVTVSTAGNYMATVSNACGQSGPSNTVSVTVGAAPSAPVLSANGSTSLCAGQSILITAANVCSDCTVNWSNGQSGPAVTVSTAGNYTATVSNACGQSGPSNTVSVTVGAAPNAPVLSANGSTSLCAGQSVLITAANACSDCTINWSNGQSGPVITVSTAGNYTATVSNACGQSGPSNTVSVTVGAAPNAPVLSANGSTSLCAGQSVLITAANVCSDCTVNWSNGQSGPVITVSTAGNYTATVSNACGQSGPSNTVSLTVTPIPILTVSASPSAPCAGQTITLTAAGAATYLWSGIGLLANVGSSVTANPPAPGAYVYAVTGTTNGCSSVPQSIPVEVSPANMLSASINVEGCPGPNLTFSTNVLHGGANVNILWHRNGQPVWSGPIYTLFSATNGDEVYCVVTPVNLPPCTQPATTTSDTHVVSCIPLGTPFITGVESAVLAPNPNDGRFRLQLELSRPLQGRVQVLNALGQVVVAETVALASGSQALSLHLDTPAPGPYWLVLQSEGQLLRMAFVVQ